ncbi:hypothetical protein L2E82_26034 [Cichorium intybus]|uniref:Uncharacterized protein n=1 Tax=Cichorium intybus TaxID=13427 RepID=A0ACB9E4P1_CICIN|nr:hypothetical protein L2E82_26034 [Cichorium intybus]
MDNTRLFAKVAKFSRLREDIREDKWTGNASKAMMNPRICQANSNPKDNKEIQERRQGNGFKRENVSFADAVKGVRKTGLVNGIESKEGSLSSETVNSTSGIKQRIELEIDKYASQALKSKLIGEVHYASREWTVGLEKGPTT